MARSTVNQAPTTGNGIHASAALLPAGWASSVDIRWDAQGRITRVVPDCASSRLPQAKGPVISGMPNLHSHAFQRTLVGRTQQPALHDDFWTWRGMMYHAASRLDPKKLEAVSAWLFAELVASGYTSVVEFHYIHRPGGAPAHESAEAILSAARSAGIRLTIAPVLYRFGDIGQSPAEDGQRPFLLSPTEYGDLFHGLESRPETTTAIAPHSIRAIAPEDLGFLSEMAGPETPIHIHVSEQPAEVEGAKTVFGATPIAWLADQCNLDARWALVHCTHATESELRTIRTAGSTMVLCPTTEHDLGDGRFPLENHPGCLWGIGSDSQVSTSPMEELRQVEYGMRAAQGSRGVLPASAYSDGTALWQATSLSSANAMGQRVGRIEPGYLADLLVLDGDAPLFAGLTPDQAVSALVLSGDQRNLAEVLVGGRCRASHGVHEKREALGSGWAKAVREVFA